MTDSATLGIILGAVLGFIGGAIAVCVTFMCYRRKSSKDSYNASEVDGRRRTIEYYSAASEGFLPPAHTRQVPVQPKIYRLSKKDEEDIPESEEGSQDDETERVRVTEPYDYKAMDLVSEEGSEAGETISELASEAEASPLKPKNPLKKQLSLPAMVSKVPTDLVHHSPEKFLRNKNGEPQVCMLELSLFYDTASKELHITVIQVSGIPTPDESFLRAPNCSVKMRILPEMLHWQWTRKISRTVNPVFNETFIVPGFVHNKLRECTAHFIVLDFDHVQDNVYVIGEVFMPLSELRANRLEKIMKRVNPLSF